MNGVASRARPELAGSARPGSGVILTLDRLTKVFDDRGRDVHAVDELSLDVAAGEFLTLLGPSGSGKTTLLHLLAGLARPTAGRILLGDADITDVPPQRRGMGVVFQNYCLFPHLTVAENVAYPLRLRKVRRAEVERRAEAALAMVRLDGFGHRYANQLSGGQQQRVAIARALVFEPAVLLMDEPLGALDRALRLSMQQELRTIQQRLGVTCVYVTHDQEEAMVLSDRVAVVSGGRLQQLDTPEGVYRRPANEFVATFIGEITLLAGQGLAASGPGGAVRLSSGAVVRTLEPVPPGEEARVGIRPEVFRVSDPGAPDALAVEVDSVRFVGTRLLVTGRVAGSDEAVALQLDPGLEVATGTALWVRVPPESVLVFPAAGSPG